MNIPNPTLYRELSEPIESLQDANDRISELMNGVGELRKKYHIVDLVAVVRVVVAADDTRPEHQAFAHFGFGHPSEWEAMLAYALGIEQAERQQRIGELLAGVVKRKAPR